MTQTTTDPKDTLLIQVARAESARGSTLNEIIASYPYPDADWLHATAETIATMELSDPDREQLQQHMQELERHYSQAKQTIEAERRNSVIDAILAASGQSSQRPPAPNDFFAADHHSLSAGVTKQHWTAAMEEWLDADLEPDSGLPCSVTLQPDARFPFPFIIDMNAESIAANSEYQLVFMTAYPLDECGKRLASAVWLRHLSNLPEA